MTRVKICGIRTADDAALAARLGADFIGLVFAPSPRQITLEEADAVRSGAADGTARVGVFVDPEQPVIDAAVEAGGLSYLQLHGSESQAFCARQRLPVIKVVRVGSDDADAMFRAYEVDAFLLDTYDPERAGGSGRTFAWKDARRWVQGRRVFLAGGLTAGNVEGAIRTVGPYAVDVSSGVESTPGHKDPLKIAGFLDAVRAADRGLAGERG